MLTIDQAERLSADGLAKPAGLVMKQDVLKEDAVAAAPPAAGKEAMGTSSRRLRDRLLNECEAMAQHALSASIDVPADLFDRYDAYLNGAADPGTDQRGSSDLARLPTVHAELAKLIAPAKPSAVLLMRDEAERRPFWSSLGPVPIARHFFLLSALSLIGLLGVSLSSEINSENLKKSLLEISGYKLFVTEGFLLAAASLGSCFANLQRLKSFISAGTYDPKFQSSYWARWVMGVISGILLSQILYGVITGMQGEDHATMLSPELGEPALALLGGYSADLVHRALNRVIAAVDTLIGGQPDRPIA